MEVKNCIRCGRVFSSLSSKICSECEKQEEEQYKLVKEYIMEHKECTLDEVVAETEVPMKRIAKFIREGRLEISQGMSGDFVCESCGNPITIGRFCDKCFSKVKNDIGAAFQGQNPALANVRVKGKMHIKKSL